MGALLPRREQFCRNVIKAAKDGRSKAWAYREAGYQAGQHGAEVCASRLLKNVDIQRRIAQLQAPAVRKAQVTASALIEDLQAARRLAIDLGKPGDAIKATMATARIAGLLVEKREIGAAGAFDRSEMLDAI